MIGDLILLLHQLDEVSTPHGAGHFRRKETELEAASLTLNEPQTLFLGLSRPQAQKRIPIFGGRVLHRGVFD